MATLCLSAPCRADNFPSVMERNLHIMKFMAPAAGHLWAMNMMAMCIISTHAAGVERNL